MLLLYFVHCWSIVDKYKVQFLEYFPLPMQACKKGKYFKLDGGCLTKPNPKSSLQLPLQSESAISYIYIKVEPSEEQKLIYKLVYSRIKAAQDISQCRCIKSPQGTLLCEDIAVKDRCHSDFHKLLDSSIKRCSYQISLQIKDQCHQLYLKKSRGLFAA